MCVLWLSIMSIALYNPSSPSQFAAARIIENMDPSADPCEDFFQYACGGWLQNNEIPEEDSRFGVLDGISEEVDKAVKGE